MSGQPDRSEEDELSIAEKILRVQDLWDDIARSPRGVDLTPAQREEAERRLLEHEKNPGKYRTWEEVRTDSDHRNLSWSTRPASVVGSRP